jgi:DNA-binding transcriptional ArsR family regulator
LSRQADLSRIGVVIAHAKVLESGDELLAITHPTRLRILDVLRTPDSAAGVARALGEPRQRINHHVKELARAGLVLPAGERRAGNFVEQLYESAAGTFVLSPRLTWGDGARVRALADQLALRHLVEFGERLQRDAAGLLDRAAFDAEEIPSASVEATVHFTDAAARARFLDEYLALVGDLIERHATATGPAFTVGVVVHPTPEEP